MFLLHRLNLNLLRLLWRLWLWLFFLVCLVILLLALMFPKLPAYKPEIEQWVSTVLEQPVTIGNITTYWLDWMPTVALQQVRLLDAEAEQSVVEIAYAEIVFNVFASLKQTQVITDSMTLSSRQLTLARNHDGSITLVGLPEKESADKTAFLPWLLQQPHISLHVSTLTWQEPEQPPLAFYNLNLLIQQQNNDHKITGRFDLPQQVINGLQTNTVSFESSLPGGTHSSGGQIEVKGHINVLSLEKLLDKLPAELLGTIDPELWTFLTTLQGTLHDIQWTYAPDYWRVRARLTDFTTKPVGQLPGIRGLSGQIDIQPNKGTLHFDQTAVTFNLPNLYNHPLSLAQLTGTLNWRRTQQQWHLTTKKLQAIDNRTKMKLQVAGSIEMPVTGGVPNSNLVVTLYEGQLSQLSKYIPKQRLSNIVRQLSEIQLRGHLSKAQLLINGKGEQTHFELKGHFKQVHFKLAKQGTQTSEGNTKLAVHNLSGQIHLKPDKGTLHLEQAAVTLNLPNLYSHPLSLTRLKGNLSWQRTQQKWQVMTKNLQAFDNNMKIQMSGHLDIPQPGGVPYSHLKVTLRNGRLSQVPHYFPDRKWQKLVRWFNEAQLRGSLNKAHALIQGPINALFDTEQSRFEFKADINNAHINYASGWPDLSNLNAEVFIKGQSLTITVQQGNILNSKLGNTVVEIADLSTPLLSVVGSTQGPAVDGLRFIQNSPLRDKIDLNRLELDGLIDLALNLTIPLANQQPTKVQGSILFKETTLYEKPLDIILTDVAGQLNFSDNGVSTQNLRGKLLGYPVSFSILTLANKQPKRTMIQVTGFAEPLFLSQQLTQLQTKTQEKQSVHSENRISTLTKVLTTSFSGTTRWSVTVTVPNEQVMSNNFIDIHFQADLLGMDIKLPAPLGKTAQEQRPFRLSVRLGERGSGIGSRGSVQGERENTEILVRIRYGDILNGAFRLNQMGLERGSLVLGTTPAQLPEQASLTIKGQLPNLSITAWLDQLNQEPKTDSSQLDSTSAKIASFPIPILMDIHFDRLEMLGQTFANVALQAKYANLLWQAAITAANVEGQITFNQSEKTPSLDLSFRELTLTVPQTQPPARPQNAPPDPHHLPPLSFHCDALHIDNINLGNVGLQTQPHYDGLKINLKAPALGLNVEGQWRYVVQRHQTILQAELKSENIGLLLQQLGYQNPPLVGKQSQITLNAYWQDAPYQFKLSTVVGTLSLMILKGRITDVEPGVGRLFGLFDMYALPRRLILDFSDVFEKGFGFNIIAGVFSIKNGSAHTKHLILQAPSARVEISGQTNLIDQYYDHIVTVSPHVSSPLAVAGALAGGVGGGVVAWVVEQLLRTRLKQVINFQYHITGSWKEPKILPLTKQ